MRLDAMKTLIKDAQKKIQSDDRFPMSYAELDESSSCANPRTALIDSAGTILAVNTDWMVLAQESGADLNRVGPGANYLAVCRHAGNSSVDSRKALAGIHAVLKGKTESFAMDYVCQTALGSAYFRMGVTPILYNNARLVITHTDITDLQVSR